MNDTHDSARKEHSGPATDIEAAAIIERYIAGSDSERDEIAADHPALITEEIRSRAEQTRRRPQRTWTDIGAAYTTPERRPDILRAIASLQWHDVSDEKPLKPPAAPGLAIKACVQELRTPGVDQIAWHGAHSTVEWHDDDGEGQHYSIYGIQANYANGRARLYVIDVGTATIPLLSDFWPTAQEQDGQASK